MKGLPKKNTNTNTPAAPAIHQGLNNCLMITLVSGDSATVPEKLSDALIQMQNWLAQTGSMAVV